MLPFRSSDTSSTGNFDTAKKVLLRIERRFRFNTVLRDAYHSFMQEYIDLAHISEIANENFISLNELNLFYYNIIIMVFLKKTIRIRHLCLFSMLLFVH